MGEGKGSGCSLLFECVWGTEGEGAVSLLSPRGLLEPLEAVKNVLRSPNRSSSSRRGENRDLVSERTPESSLAEEELLSPLLREWKSADDSEPGVMSGKERLLLRLAAAWLLVSSPGVSTAVTSDPGDKILLARLRFMDGGGGSILGIVWLDLSVRDNNERAQSSLTKYPLFFPVKRTLRRLCDSTTFIKTHICCIV